MEDVEQGRIRGPETWTNSVKGQTGIREEVQERLPTPTDTPWNGCRNHVWELESRDPRDPGVCISSDKGVYKLPYLVHKESTRTLHHL